MITLVRLDERLIHGQIAIKWSRYTGVDRIIVANDIASSNEIIRNSLMMAAPSICKTAIKSVEDTIKMLENPKAAEHKILLIVSNPDDLIRILENVSDIEAVNIGNYGRMEPKTSAGNREAYTKNIYLYPEEVDKLHRVKELGFDAFIQTIPDDPQESLEKVLSKK